MTDTKKLRELLAAATPGPWVAVRQLATASRNRAAVFRDETAVPGGEITCPALVRGKSKICDLGKTPMSSGGPTWENNRNAALIVAAVNSLPALLDELEALRAAGDAVADRLDEYTADGETCLDVLWECVLEAHEVWRAIRAQQEQDDEER
jgi:hypothetical protein